MRFTKVFGLAAVAAVAAMAFIGTSSAFAVDNVVICKTLVNSGALCPAGNLWLSGSVVEALATQPKLESSFGPDIVCEDSIVKGETLADKGNPNLGFKITSLIFGALPTPSLGNGCTTCTGGVHTTVPITGTLGVEATDKFYLEASGQAELLGCPFSTTCIYGALVKSGTITHTGSHATHSGTNLAVIPINFTLTKKAGSSFACPSSGQWVANYVVTLVKSATEEGLGWPALDN